MQQIKQILLKHPHDYSNILIWAICCTAFFGFLRCSEFTVPQEHECNPTVHWMWRLTAEETHRSYKFIPNSQKTDPFRKGVKSSLGRTDNAIYPVGADLAYLAVRGSQPGTLFLTKQNKPLTQQHFCSALTAILIDIGLSPHNFNTHSFRIGAATSAKHANISDTHLKMLDHWRSDIYQKLYLHGPI